MRHNIKTSEQLTLPFGADASTCSPEDSPASRSALQASGKVRLMTVTSGRRCCEQFELYDRSGSWAKTFTALLIGREGWYSSKCALTWKMRATPSKRIYFQLVPSTLPTDATECGLLPTIQTQGLKICKEGRSYPMNLKMLPTLTARDSRASLVDRGKNLLGEIIHGANGCSSTSSRLNPLFVAEMMGFPPNWTVLPFRDGGESR